MAEKISNFLCVTGLTGNDAIESGAAVASVVNHAGNRVCAVGALKNHTVGAVRRFCDRSCRAVGVCHTMCCAVL